MIRLEQINDVVVKPIATATNTDKRPVRGYELIPEPFASIFLCAKKKSGKTNVVYKILKNCIGKNTIVIVFASTFNKDENWIEIKKWMKKNNINFTGHTSMFDDNTGADQLVELVKFLSEEAQRKEEERDVGPIKKPIQHLRFDED